MKRLLASRVKNLVYRIIKGKTVGVRALIIKGEKTLLVKHSYRPLWYMPGGGVDAKETGIQAVRRELEEEVNISCENFELFGFYHSEQEHHDDYVALYVTHLSEDKYKIDEQEIAQANWFRPIGFLLTNCRKIFHPVPREELKSIWGRWRRVISGKTFAQLCKSGF